LQDAKLRLILVLPFNALFIINNDFNFHTFKKMNSIFIIMSFFNTAHRSLFIRYFQIIGKYHKNIWIKWHHQNFNVYNSKFQGKHNTWQGYNARKVISEVYASFELQCTVSGRQCKHRKDVEAWHGTHLSHKKSIKYSGHRKLLCELSKLSKCYAFNIIGY